MKKGGKGGGGKEEEKELRREGWEGCKEIRGLRGLVRE